MRDRPIEPKEEKKKFVSIGEVKEGDYFGEIGLLSNLRRTCSVYAISTLHCSIIDKPNFEILLE